MLTRLASTVCATALVAFLLAAAPIAPERGVPATGTGIGVNTAPAIDTTLGTATPALDNGGLAPRQLWTKRSSASIQLPVDPVTHHPQWNGRLSVKFRDDLKVRAELVPSEFVRGADGMPIPAVTELLRTVGGSMRQMLRHTPEELRQLEIRAERKSKRAQPDLAGMVYVDVTPDRLLDTARAFNDLDIVEWVEIERNQVLHGGGTNTADQYGCGENGPGDSSGITNCYTTSPTTRCSALGGGNGCNNPGACANPNGPTANCRYGCNNTACCETVSLIIPGCNVDTGGQGWDALCATYANIVCIGNVYDNTGASPGGNGGAPGRPSIPGSYKFDPCFALRGPIDFTNSNTGVVPSILIQGQQVIPNVTALAAPELQVPSQLLTYELDSTGQTLFSNDRAIPADPASAGQTAANTVLAIPYPNGQISDEGDATTGVPQQALSDPSLEGAYLSISAGCFSQHSFGGCNQVSCCVWVCRNDPYCCVVSWDDSCALRASTLDNQAGPFGDTPCTPQSLPGSCPAGVATGAFPTCVTSETPDLSGGPELAPSGLPIPNSARGFQLYKTKEAILAPFDTLPDEVPALTYPLALPVINSGNLGNDDRSSPLTNRGTLAMLNSTFRGGGLDLAGFERVASDVLRTPRTAGNSCHGESITVAVIEPSAYLNHEELIGRVTVEPNQTQLLVIAPPLDPNHGTAVLGIIGAKSDSPSPAETGISGIAYGSALRFYPSVSREEGSRIQNALTNAILDLEEGDIITIAVGLGGSSGGNGQNAGDTILVDASVFSLVRVATDVGITSVVSAGNDSAPVRTSPAADNGPDPGVVDSGAVVVGACWPGYQVGRLSTTTSVQGPYPGQNYCRMNFSNFTNSEGTATVNLSAWGTGVTTLGYGDLWLGQNPEPPGEELQANKLRSYTALFNGTSAAAAMIAGWCACIQGFSVAYWGAPQGPTELRTAISRYDPNAGGIRNVFPQCGLPYTSAQFPGYPDGGDASAGDLIAGGTQAQIGGFPNCPNTASYILSNTFGGAPVNLNVITGTLKSGNSFSLRERDGSAVAIDAINKRAGTKGQGYGSPLFYPLNGPTTDIQLQLQLSQSPQLVTGVRLETFSRTSWNLPVIEVVYFYNWKQRRWQGAGNLSLNQIGAGTTFRITGPAQDYAIANSSGGSSIYARVYTCGLGSNNSGYTVLHDLLALRVDIDDVFNPGGP